MQQTEQVRRPVVLGVGSCAVPVDDGIWIGLLHGDLTTGWCTSAGLVAWDEMPAFAAVLRGGGAAHGRSVSLLGDGTSATVHIRRPAGRGGRTPGTDSTGSARTGSGSAGLGSAATARLQILLAAVASGRVVRPTSAGRAPLPVTPTRGGLAVDGVGHVDAGSVVVAVDALEVGAVGVTLQDLDGGRTSLSLPALPLLLAAAEAQHDGVDVGLLLRSARGDRSALEGTMAPDAAMRAAAAAQWLFPDVLRRARAV